MPSTEAKGRIRFSFDAGSSAADFDTMSRLVLKPGDAVGRQHPGSHVLRVSGWWMHDIES